jgi:hypothetical protein
MDLYSYDAPISPKCFWRTSNGVGANIYPNFEICNMHYFFVLQVVQPSQAKGTYLLAPQKGST